MDLVLADVPSRSPVAFYLLPRLLFVLIIIRVAYRNCASHRTPVRSIFRIFLTLVFIAQGCDNSGMCDDSGPCAENELNDLISRSDAHPCAVTPTCATLNKSHTLPCCDVNAHPCAVDMYVRYGGNHTPHCCTGGAPFERPPCAIPNSTMCYTEHTSRVETDRHCCLCVR